MSRENWLEWRNKGLGSSDAPIVMGVSPWSTPYQLWEQKCGMVKKAHFSNPAIDRGNALEPKARAQYELENEISMPAQLVEHEKHPWLRASLDGYNSEARIVLEIKCPGTEDHNLALSGKVPEKYLPQCQHQLLVTGAKRVDYYSYDGEQGVVVQVYPDMDYCRELMARLEAFWKCVQDKTPPALTDRDKVRVRDEGLKDLAREWLAAKHAADDARTAEELAKSRLKAAIESRTGAQPRLVIGDVNITRSFRKGPIDYGLVPELKGIDLERYRKPGSATWTFTEVKAGEE